MLTHVLAILGLGALCGVWVLIQHWVASRDPEAPTLETCHTCSSASSCSRERKAGPRRA